MNTVKQKFIQKPYANYSYYVLILYINNSLFITEPLNVTSEPFKLSIDPVESFWKSN